MMRVVLASSSPRRRELLARAGIRFNVVEPPEDATAPPGVCAFYAHGDREAMGVSRSAVKMHAFSDDELATYVASGEPLDRSGGYAIQGGGGDLVEAVAGRVDTVIGLDVPLALRLLTEIGYPDPLPRPSDVSLTPPRVRRPLTPLRAPTRV